MMVISEKKAWS